MKTLILLIISMNLYAKTGFNIMKEIDRRGQGFIGSKSKITMTLIDAYNKKVERVLLSKIIEDNKNGNKSITEFLKPLDIKGTKLLTWSLSHTDNKQWLFLPQFKRTKKINSRGQSGSFMGSEFSYEDIAGTILEKYSYKLLSEDKSSWTIESVPKKKSGYTKTITTVNKKDYTIQKVKYFDRKGELLKVSSVGQYKVYFVGKKKFKLSNKILMLNKQTQKRSILQWFDRKLGLKHKRSDFKSSKLK